MQLSDHVAAGAILLLAIIQAFTDPAVLRNGPKLTFYKAGALTGVFLGGLILLQWLLEGRPISDFGLYNWRGSTSAVVAAAAWTLLLFGAFRLCAGPFQAGVSAYYDRFRFLLPERRSELGPAYAAGVLAGMGEEIAFRGLLFWYVATGYGLSAALLVTSVAFGIAHGYQGRTGVIFATIAGLILGLAYILSGSLLLVLWMHASYNVFSFTLGYTLLGTDGDPFIGAEAEER